MLKVGINSPLSISQYDGHSRHALGETTGTLCRGIDGVVKVGQGQMGVGTTTSVTDAVYPAHDGALC